MEAAPETKRNTRRVNGIRGSALFNGNRIGSPHPPRRGLLAACAVRGKLVTQPEVFQHML